MKTGSSRLGFLLSMIIFGTIGVFRRSLLLPSGVIALSRGVVGTIALLLIVVISRRGLSWRAIRRNLPVLCVSGALVGLNWVALFEAYRYTTVATATLCYYMAPIFVILSAPFVLRERLTLRKGICAFCALLGMVLVSGVLTDGGRDLRGIAYGLLAAAFYATVMLLNQKLRDLSAYERTVVQLAMASAVVLPYVLMMEDVTASAFTPSAIALLLIMGVLHTGVAYALYFGSMERLSAQTVAIFSYVDPIVALLLSATVLREGMSMISILGALLVLGSAIVSELSARTRKAETVEDLTKNDAE